MYTLSKISSSHRFCCHSCSCLTVSHPKNLSGVRKRGWSINTRATGLNWSGVKTETQFKNVLRVAHSKGYLSENLCSLWEEFFNNYKEAVLRSEVEGHDEAFVVEIQSLLAEKVFDQFQQPYEFPSYHKRLLEPFNYYEMGQRYVGSLIDFENSFLGHIERWRQISEQLKAGHNVVLLCNHQTEADPGVFAHMLHSEFLEMAENVIYVAGDRVITDPLCKPFSMGRNLFCVYSKRHIDDDPEKKKHKLATNQRTLITMARQLNQGGLLLWIAPSGGRDRPRDDGRWTPNTFDPSSVELMRRLVQSASKDGHLYAMGMVSWKLMPPPVKIGIKIGERRETNFAGVGISVTPEINVDEVLEGVGDDPEIKQQTLAEFARNSAEKEFLLLEKLINEPECRSQYPEYSQPWLKQPASA